MSRDPLSVFLHEKVAAADAPTTADPPHHVTKNPSVTSMDPGERALAGIVAAGSSIAAKVVPWIADTALRHYAGKGAVPWHNAIPVQGAKNFGDILEGATHPTSKLLGLFNVSARSRVARSEKDIIAVNDAVSKVQEIHPIVDSFIDHHNLIEKGVRINLNRGVLGGALKNRYHIPSKEVYLSSISKEQALHELGHAADFTGSRLGKFRGVAGEALTKGALIALPIAMVAGDHIKKMMPGTIDDRAISFMQDHAPAIMGATLAATSLYPEAKASFLAVRHIARTEGPEAARKALKVLAPGWGTYLLGAIPAVVGLSLARKYMREARAENEKTAGPIGEAARDLWHGISESALDVAHIGKQIGHQTVAMINEPGILQRLGHAAKEVGTSPEFIQGALTAAIPATMGAMYLYATPSGKAIRSRMHPDTTHQFLSEKGKRTPIAGRTHEEWRERNPMRFVSLVAAGAALSGGILSKFFSDLQRVM